MSDFKVHIPVKFVINDLFDDDEVGEAMTKLSAKAWAQFSKIFKIEEQKRKRAAEEILHAALAHTLTPEYLAVRLVCNPDLEAKSSDDETPLMWSALHGKTQCLKMLLDAKANIHARDRYERTALHYASRKGHPECVQVLIEAGAEVEAENDDGNTPLITAACFGKPQCLKMLIDAKAYIHVRDHNEWTALHYASRKGHPECVQVLIAAGAEVDVENDHGNTPLITAALGGKPQCLKMLIDAKANIHARNVNERTALRYAAREGHPECVQVLIEAGADVDAKTDEGATPLLEAAWSDKHACMTLLLNHGASVWTEDNYGSTPMSYALANVSNPDYNGTDEDIQATLEILLQHSPNEHGITALMVAASEGDDDAIPILLEMGEDPELEDKNGMTALMMAMMPLEDEVDWEVERKHLIIILLRGDRTNAELNEMRRVLYFPKVPPPLNLPE